MKRFSGKDHHYFEWGLTAFIVIACAILFYFGLDYLAALVKAIGSFLSILSPFIWGLIIAYLLIPAVDYFEDKLFTPWIRKYEKKHPKAKKRSKIARVFSVTLAEILFVLLIVALFYLIVPQLYESIVGIVINSPEYINKVSMKLDTLLKDYPQIEQSATAIFGNITDALTTWAKTKLIPGMESIVTNITTGVAFVVKVLYKIIVGIVVSIYVLGNKEKIKAYSKKLLYTVFSPKSAGHINTAVQFADKTFMGFIVGRLLDSAIIGVICYVFFLIFKMPYPLLIAVIMGVTNIIPFFGPFIGAIPSALFILIISPAKCLGFIIFVLILKEFDGNILSPKILGSAIGINGFWIIFAIILFGGLFGFWGMLLGVPVFAIIYTAIEMVIDRRLRKNDLPTDVAVYADLERIDPDTGELVMRKDD